MKNSQDVITGQDFKCMIAGAYSSFAAEYEAINNLNVFPVPDGDTGTNMLKTLGAVANAIAEAKNETSIGCLAKRAADSAIMGARGNSGVILSQIFRGLGRGLAGKNVATSMELGKAFQYGVLYAYRSVGEPIEGTILTVAKGIAKGAYHAVRQHQTIAAILQAAISAGLVELERTPDLLPKLKEAGVVDAGGRGLIVFLEGCYAGLTGEMTTASEILNKSSFPKTPNFAENIPEEAIVRPYCTEFIVKNTQTTAAAAKPVLEKLGDSLVLAEGTELLKVHIHTAHPGRILEKAIGWGTLHDIKIDNMADQHRNTLVTQQLPRRPKMATAVIGVAAGDGMVKIMKELGATEVITGGQSMNPAVEDFMNVVHQDLADKYIILPNNRNIALAVEQVKKLMSERVEIVNTENMPQGLAALLAYDPAQKINVNVENMTESAKQVKEAAVTLAVRDSKFNGEIVPQGSYIGVVSGKVICYGDDLTKVLLDTIIKIAGTAVELVTLYTGNDIDQGTTEICTEAVTAQFSEADIEVYDGGQPLYYFIISVE